MCEVFELSRNLAPFVTGVKGGARTKGIAQSNNHCYGEAKPRLTAGGKAVMKEARQEDPVGGRAPNQGQSPIQAATTTAGQSPRLTAGGKAVTNEATKTTTAMVNSTTTDAAGQSPRLTAGGKAVTNEATKTTTAMVNSTTKATAGQSPRLTAGGVAVMKVASAAKTRQITHFLTFSRFALEFCWIFSVSLARVYGYFPQYSSWSL